MTESNEKIARERPGPPAFLHAASRALMCAGLAVAMLIVAGCPGNGDGSTGLLARWEPAFDTTETGDLSGVWGSGPDDVFIVGGTSNTGEVYHYDGMQWRAMTIPNVPLLVWVFGFGPNAVISVGEQGGAIRYDGASWSLLDTGETQALWGVWGKSPNDIWIVGGDVGVGDPVLIRYDGQTFQHYPIPENDRAATALFKVWGIGDKVFAVGERGLIIEFDGEQWQQVPAGADADEDFVSLWGTSVDNIVAVGGRGSARIATYDGSGWSTQRFASTPGLNAVFMTDDDVAVVGGVNGFAGSFNPVTGMLEPEDSGSPIALHSSWGDGTGRVYAVGGRFSEPSAGVALVRTVEQTGGGGSDNGPECENADDCSEDQICADGVCEDRPPDEEVTAVFGYVDSSGFIETNNGDDMPFYMGFQGGSHIFGSVQATGLGARTDVLMDWVVTLVDEDRVLSDFRTAVDLFETDVPGVLQITDQFIGFSAFFTEIEDKTAEIKLTLQDSDTGEVLFQLTRSFKLVLKNRFN